MSRFARLVRFLVFAAGLAPAATAAAQGSSPVTTDSARGNLATTATDSSKAPSGSAQAGGSTPPAGTSVETALPGVKLSGYAEASYLYSSAALPGGPVVGRSFDRFHDQSSLNV